MIYRDVDGKVAWQWAVEDWTAIPQDVTACRPPLAFESWRTIADGFHRFSPGTR